MGGMIDTTVSYYAGEGDFATEEYFTLRSKKRPTRSEVLKALIKSLNGCTVSGRHYQGNGDRIRVQWHSIEEIALDEGGREV